MPAPGATPVSGRLLREIPLPQRADAWALGGLAVLVVILFQDVLFRGRVLYERDIHGIWHGQTESFVRCIASGSWPLWDPYLSFGQPMLANPGTQVLYPWTWLNLIAPPALSYTLYVVGHLLLAAIGMFRLTRLQLSRGAAFVAASIWLASGPLLSLVSLWHHLAGAAWMPWVLLAADRALRSPTVGRSLVWGASFAGQILAGSADMCAMTGMLTVAYAVPFLLRRNPPLPWLRAGKTVVLSAAFALCLSAALWVPVVETARRSDRWDMASAVRTAWSVHPASLLQVALPLIPAELPLTVSVRKALFDMGGPFLSSLYVGVPALTLAAAAFAGPKPPWVFGVAAAGALAISLGRHSWAYTLAVELVPALRILRFPSKAMVPAAFSLAVLAGYGFDAWRARDALRPRRWFLLVVASALVGAVMTWAAVYLAIHPQIWGHAVLDAPRPEQTVADALGPATRKLLTAALGSTAVAVLAAAVLRWPRSRLPGAVAVGALAAGGLVAAHSKLNPTAPADLYRSRPPIVDVLKNDAARRIYVFDYVRAGGRAYRSHVPSDLFSKGLSPLETAYGLQAYLIPITGSRWGLFGSYDTDLYGLYLPSLRSLTLVLRAAEERPLHDRLLRMGAVDHVVALHKEGLEPLKPIATLPSPFISPIHVFRVPGAWPRSHVVSGVRVADGLGAYRLLADPSFDPTREVILPGGPETAAAQGSIGTSRILQLGYDRVRLEADLAQTGLLVLADTFDPGWTATVDGRGAEVLRANGAFRAVRLDPGRHRVEMVYRPASVVAGALVSAVSLLAGGAFAAARALGSLR